VSDEQHPFIAHLPTDAPDEERRLVVRAAHADQRMQEANKKHKPEDYFYWRGAVDAYLDAAGLIFPRKQPQTAEEMVAERERMKRAKR
jgi:hypothetical protein